MRLLGILFCAAALLALGVSNVWADAGGMGGAKLEPVVVDPFRAKLVAESAAARVKMANAERKSNVKAVVKMVNVPRMDANKVTREMEKSWGDKPGFAIAAFPSIQFVMIRGDEKTVADVITVIHMQTPKGGPAERKK